MKIVITGSGGFIGKNLVHTLRKYEWYDIIEYDINDDTEVLYYNLNNCDFIVHLGGVSRPSDINEFKTANVDFTLDMLSQLKKANNKCPIIFTSSIQASLDNEYGKSKKEIEDILFNYEKETGANMLLYRLPNVFGRWARPNYVSVVATFCYNISRNIPIDIHNPETILNLTHIDTVVDLFIQNINGCITKVDNYCEVTNVYSVKLSKIAELLYYFKEQGCNLNTLSLKDDFEEKLFSTYQSYLPENYQQK